MHTYIRPENTLKDRGSIWSQKPRSVKSISKMPFVKPIEATFVPIGAHCGVCNCVGKPRYNFEVDWRKPSSIFSLASRLPTQRTCWERRFQSYCYRTFLHSGKSPAPWVRTQPVAHCGMCLNTSRLSSSRLVWPNSNGVANASSITMQFVDPPRASFSPFSTHYFNPVVLCAGFSHWFFKISRPYAPRVDWIRRLPLHIPILLPQQPNVQSSAS